MKKLFLLIIASWATSCLPAHTQKAHKFSAAPPINALSSQECGELIETTETLLETTETLEKTVILDKTYIYGVQSGTAGIIVPLLCAPFLSFYPLVAIGLGTTVMCSFARDYFVSEDDKSKATGQERTLEHVKGIGSVGVALYLGFVAAKKSAKNEIKVAEDRMIFAASYVKAADEHVQAVDERVQAVKEAADKRVQAADKRVQAAKENAQATDKRLQGLYARLERVALDTEASANVGDKSPLARASVNNG